MSVHKQTAEGFRKISEEEFSERIAGMDSIATSVLLKQFANGNEIYHTTHARPLLPLTHDHFCS